VTKLAAFIELSGYLLGVPIKKKLKGAALNAFPRLALKLFSARSRRLIVSQTRELGLDDLARAISQATGGEVATGPFVHMKLDYEAFPVHASPKFLGTYEQELHSLIESAIRRSPRYVLNVGCAEGFYAVGMAMRLKNAHVFAADADPKALRATFRNAQLNGVSDRVSAVGIVQSGHLGRYLKPEESLLIMDCEGAEFSLLDPRKDPVLLGTSILVEVHAAFGNNVDIVGEFSQTHNIVEISPSERVIADIRIAPMPGIDLLSAADERRGDQTSWLFLEAKSANSA
jgi:hypothetical protein